MPCFSILFGDSRPIGWNRWFHSHGSVRPYSISRSTLWFDFVRWPKQIIPDWSLRWFPHHPSIQTKMFDVINQYRLLLPRYFLEHLSVLVHDRPNARHEHFPLCHRLSIGLHWCHTLLHQCKYSGRNSSSDLINLDSPSEILPVLRIHAARACVSVA